MICILGGGEVAHGLLSYFGDKAFIVRSSELDLTKKDDVKDFFEKNKHIEVVILCAKVGGSRLCPDPDNTVETNLRIFTNVETFSRGKLICFSSGARFNEESRYGYSKYIQERIMSNNTTCIRLYNCFGPKEISTRFISSCLQKRDIIIPGDRYFDFFHIEDLYRVIELVIDGTIKDKIFDAVYSKKYKLSEVARMIGSDPVVTGTSDSDYIGDGSVIEFMNFADLKDILKNYSNK
jgi:nucleoside-diphosphate-sugar epimerase